MEVKSETVKADKIEIQDSCRAVLVTDADYIFQRESEDETWKQAICSYTQRAYRPDADVSNEPQQVQDICNAIWTDELKQEYADSL
jgi:hypothetical protein